MKVNWNIWWNMRYTLAGNLLSVFLVADRVIKKEPLGIVILIVIIASLFNLQGITDSRGFVNRLKELNDGIHREIKEIEKEIKNGSSDSQP